MSINIGPQLVSKLGSPDSRIPLAVKDGFNSAGYTYFSYDAGGSVEGKDRFVDEAGTGAIWLFGIPVYKKIIDKTLYPIMNTSSEVDVRVVKDKNYLESAIKHSPNKKFTQELLYAKNHTTRVKALTLAKFGISMGLTMLSYLGLTKLKQKMTRLNIEKEFEKKMKEENHQYTEKNLKSTKIFSDFQNFSAKSQNKKENNTPSFGSAKMVEEFMLNPVKNMILLDVGITGERLSNARTEGEFKEYAIKEGSFLFFVYCADSYIRNGLENLSQKFLKLPIGLNANFLSSDLSKEILQNKDMKKDVKEFINKFDKNNNSNEMYNFIFENQNNTVVNAAKKSEIISTLNIGTNKEKIDTRKYIDPDKMKKLAKDLDCYINTGENKSDINKYIEKLKTAKIAATILSIGTCCAFLGYLVPKFMYEYRHKQQDGNKDFHVRTEYEKELAEKALLRAA